jgi:signal transduction histidine kinase
MEVRIRDDGVGFATDQVGSGRHGLVGMRYRVQAEGGVLTVSSQPGQGTEVHARLPAWAPATAASASASASAEPGNPQQSSNSATEKA